MGTPFMPWQQAAADVAGEYDPDTGLPYYREIDLLVMRQQGKTTAELTAAVDRFVSWPTRQRIVYSAQSGLDARKKLLEDWVPALQGSALWPKVAQVIRANGHESITWDDGSFVETMASLVASGHGFTRDLGFVDEAWKDQDDRREGAIQPAQLTVPDAQLWIVSTAGNEDSTYLKRKVEAGREAAEADKGHGTCYIEYSVPDDEDPYDLDVMLRYMPGLCRTPGPCECSDEWRHTVTHEVLRAVQESSIEKSEYRRAYGNIFGTQGRHSVIPAELWDAVQDPTAAPSGRIRVGLDVAEDRLSGALTAAGNGCVEPVDHRSGTGWMVEAAKALHTAWGAEIVIDGGGPAVPIADDLEREGVAVTRMGTPDVIAACGRMYDAIAEQGVRFRPSAVMDDAVSGLAKRSAGDRFMWSREASTADITTFFAGTLAVAHTDGPENLEGDLMA